MLTHMIMNSLQQRKLYEHVPSDKKRYIFPILGLILRDDECIEVGYIKFVSRKYLIDNILDEDSSNILEKDSRMQNVKTFAIVDLNKYGNLKELSGNGYNSIALQILKQTIGVLYILIYKTRRINDEKRIVISDNSRHEVDEGLVKYFEEEVNNKRYRFVDNTAADNLYYYLDKYSLNNINDFIKILKIPLKSRNEYQNKICNCLEILYRLYNEIYANERVIKFVMILNHIFKLNLKYNPNYNSNYIANKIKVLFHSVGNIKFNKEDLIYTINYLFNKLRNLPLHGTLEFYEEDNLIGEYDYHNLKYIVMELLILLTENKELSNLKTTQELIELVNKKKEDEIRKCIQGLKENTCKVIQTDKLSLLCLSKKDIDICNNKEDNKFYVRYLSKTNSINIKLFLEKGYIEHNINLDNEQLKEVLESIKNIEFYNINNDLSEIIELKINQRKFKRFLKNELGKNK